MKIRGKQCFKRFMTDLNSYKWVMIAAFLYYCFTKLIFHAFCPMVIMTGLPCPGCGMVRAVLCILTGQFVRGWNLNPFAFAWMALALWCVYRRYWCGKPMSGWKQMAGLILIGMVLLYLYRMITRFPSYSPIVYTPNNILARMQHRF
ncbi:MAG: DUF2752 domain-containing protein [Lachnospiraceae bacterium]